LPVPWPYTPLGCRRHTLLPSACPCGQGCMHSPSNAYEPMLLPTCCLLVGSSLIMWAWMTPVPTTSRAPLLSTLDSNATGRRLPIYARCSPPALLLLYIHSCPRHTGAAAQHHSSTVSDCCRGCGTILERTRSALCTRGYLGCTRMANPARPRV